MTGAEMLLAQMVKGLGLDPDQIGKLADTILNGHQAVLRRQDLLAQGVSVMLRQQAAIMDHLNLQADEAAGMLTRLLAAPSEAQQNDHGNGSGIGDGGSGPGGSPAG